MITGDIVTYKANLASGRQIYIENRDNQTLITVSSSGAGQQQSQRSGFETGEWQRPPTLFQVAHDVVLRVEAGNDQFFFRLSANGIQTLDRAPEMGNAEALPLQKAGDNPGMKPMEPMQPMQRMKPLEPMKPMEMRMGDMSMSMGQAESSVEGSKEVSTRSGGTRFCTQCGHAAEPGDRFCAHCGHGLRSADS